MGGGRGDDGCPSGAATGGSGGAGVYEIKGGPPVAKPEIQKAMKVSARIGGPPGWRAGRDRVPSVAILAQGLCSRIALRSMCQTARWYRHCAQIAIISGTSSWYRASCPRPAGQSIASCSPSGLQDAWGQASGDFWVFGGSLADLLDPAVRL